MCLQTATYCYVAVYYPTCFVIIVTACCRSAFTFSVTGTISVSNPNTQAVSATSVSAQVPAGYVLAACQGGRFPISIPAGGSILCAFNATLTDAAGSQGSVTAFVESAFGPSTSTVAVPYSLDAPTTAQGACAVLSDAITSRPTLAAGGVSVTGSKAYSDKAQPVCQDASYNVTARFGPFGENDCNMYTVRAGGCSGVYGCLWLGLFSQQFHTCSTFPSHLHCA